MNKRGRKSTTYSEEVLFDIIQKYRETFGIKGKIKYLDVYRFNKEMYEKGELEQAFSEDFWRKSNKPGRMAIDEANQLTTQKLDAANGEIEIPNIEDLVYKYAKNDNEELIDLLKPLKEELEESLKREKQQKEKADTLQEKYLIEKKKREELEIANKKLQDTLFKMFRYSGNEEILINHLRTGKTKTKRVENALKQVFSDPIAFFEEREEKRNISNENNVVEIKSKKRTLAEDFKGKF